MACRAAPDAELLDLVEYMLSFDDLRLAEAKKSLDTLFIMPRDDVPVRADADAWLLFPAADAAGVADEE